MPNDALSEKESAFLERYYREEYKDLYYYALHLLRSESLAEVAVQNTFEIAARRIDVLMTHENPVGWLYVVMRYTVYAIWRDQAAAKERCVSLEEVTQQSIQMTEPDELDWDDPDFVLLRRFYVEGYCMKELAAEYHTTVAAMKMRICRIKKRLREDPKINNLGKIFG